MAMFGPQFVLSEVTHIFVSDEWKGMKFADMNGNLLFYTHDKNKALKRDDEPLCQVRPDLPLGTAVVAKLRKKLMGLRDTYNIYKGDSTEDSDKVAFAQSKMISILGDTVKVMLAGESEPCITIKGNWRDRFFQYTNASGVVVAEAIRKGRFQPQLSAIMNFACSDDDFLLTIQPGCDIVFILAITTLLNNIVLNPK